MIKNTLFFAAMLFMFQLSPAQEKIPGTFQGRYHMLSPNELHQKIDRKAFISTPPPEGEVRNIAEFEPTEGILITYDGWGFGIPHELIAEIAEDVNVVTIVYNQEDEDEVRDFYTSLGINLDHCIFLQAANNTYWCRDYGPWFVAVNDTISLVNFPYNRPRANDDNIPIAFAQEFAYSGFGMNLVHTGGNWMCDGLGVAASTDLVYEENPTLSADSINSLVEAYLGIEKYHVVSDPLQDYIKHVDCWGKFLDVDKILIAQVSESDWRYEDYEAAANYWANQTSSYGNKYQVYRVYSPNGQPYTNSLIVNNKVLVPVNTGLYGEWNDEALNTYRAAMPGYEVIGFEQNPDAPWESTDALHCRTHEIPDREMLYIEHRPLLGNIAEQAEYKITANLNSYAGHDILQCALFYSLNNGDFTQLFMTETENNSYEASIPMETTKLTGTVVNYYLKATDEEGKTFCHPFIGEADPHEFTIGSTTQITMTENILFSARTFPNPTYDKLFISISSETINYLVLSIVDISGKVVDYKYVTTHQGNDIITFNVSGLNSGLYMLRMENELKQIITKRFIKN